MNRRKIAYYFLTIGFFLAPFVLFKIVGGLAGIADAVVIPAFWIAAVVFLGLAIATPWRIISSGSPVELSQKKGFNLLWLLAIGTIIILLAYLEIGGFSEFMYFYWYVIAVAILLWGIVDFFRR